MISEANQELSEFTESKKVYVLIINGREHNVYITEIGEYYVKGRVAQNKLVMLVNRPGRGGVVVKVVLPQDEKNAVGPGDELLHSAPCVVPSPNLWIRIKLDDISVVEDPWRPMLDDSVFAKDGTINNQALCQIIPSLRNYFVEGKGFVASPSVWQPTLQKDFLKNVPVIYPIRVNNVDDEESTD
jgi:hypothetical protein